MRPDDIKNEVEQLSLTEKLLLVEDIWDSIAQSNISIPLSEWQKKELDNRYKAFKTGNVELHDWKSVHQSLNKDYK